MRGQKSSIILEPVFDLLFIGIFDVILIVLLTYCLQFTKICFVQHLKNYENEKKKNLQGHWFLNVDSFNEYE